jgi:hypothetical protein
MLDPAPLLGMGTGSDLITASLPVGFTLKRIITIRPTTEDPDEQGERYVCWSEKRPPSLELSNMNHFVVPSDVE